MRKGLSIFLILLFSLIDSGYSQVIDVSDLYVKDRYFFPYFEPIGEEINMPHFLITSMIEDHEGYVWIGTRDGGLVRYFGYGFSAYEMDPYDPFSLTSNEVLSLFEDSRNILWVGTDNALCFFQSFTERFVKINLSSIINDDGLPISVNCITESSDGKLYIGTNVGIWELSDFDENLFNSPGNAVIDPDSAGINIREIVIHPEASFLDYSLIQDIKFDTGDNFWILDEKELGYINSDQLNQKAGQRSKRRIIPNYQKVTSINFGSKISFGSKGMILVNNQENLYKITPHSESFQVTQIAYQSNMGSIDQLISDKPDSERIWTGHFASKLLLYDEAFGQFFPLTVDDGNIRNLDKFGVSCFLRTTSNVFFIGTLWGGLFKFVPNPLLEWVHPNLQAIHQNQADNLRFVYEDSKGHVWIAARHIYRCNKYTGKILETFDEKFFNGGWVYANKMIEDRHGRFWMGMESSGLYILDINESKLGHNENHSVRSTQIIKDNTITALFEDQEGTIWAGAFYGDIHQGLLTSVLYRIRGDGKILGSYVIKESVLRKGIDATLMINQIISDNHGGVWLATGFGLIHFSSNHDIKTYHFLKNREQNILGNKILTICHDFPQADSILWIGTANNGLHRFNLTDGSFTLVAKAPELPANHIATMQMDNQGDLWLGTDRGISKLTSVSKEEPYFQIHNYYVSDGLITNDFTYYFGSNSVKTDQGDLIFTGMRGFQIIEPLDFTIDSIIPPVLLSEFSINYEPADFGEDGSPLQVPISLTESIIIPFEKNTLGFEMTALNFKSLNNIKYAYKLENYDDDWILNGSSRNIQYTKLPPGQYILKVKVATLDEYWSEEMVSLNIRIRFPWWFNVYSISFYLLVLFTIVWLIIRTFRNRQKMKTTIQRNKLEAEKYKELDQIKSKFFANISHEFKTALTLIINPVQELLMKSTGSTHQSLQMVERNARKVQLYISEILDLSRIDAHKLEIQLVELEIIDFLNHQRELIMSMARSKNITIDLSTSLKEVKFFADPEKLGTIISNLLSNAIKFTPVGGMIELGVSCCIGNLHEHCAHNHGCLIISVKDNGVGIPKTHIPFIFDRYYKVHNDQSEFGSGTGLGLALTKELVHLHHGTITVISEENVYTTFQIRFPIGQHRFKTGEIVETCRYETAEDFEFEAAINARGKNREDSESDDLNTSIVLVIEDNRDMRKLISTGLKKHFKIIEANDGNVGIAKALETIPDIIVCDVMMPEKDGFQVTRTLKSNEMTSHIPIILLTARSEIEDRITGLEIGADDYLNKPFYPRELITRVKNLLEQREHLKKKYSGQNSSDTNKPGYGAINQVFIDKTLKIIEQNLSDENFDVQMLVKEIGLSRAQLHRKLKAITGQSTHEFILAVRMNHASVLLKNKEGSISEIGYRVGFSNPPSFSRAFKHYFGHSPSEHL